MRSVLLVAAVTFLGLAACEEGAVRRARLADAGKTGLCTPFTEVGTASGLAGSMLGDASYAVDDCLHRWGYTLARSKDEADAVARAVMAACAEPLARWNQQSLGAGSGARMQGAPANPVMEHANFAAGRALFYVVQGRAGDCEPPHARQAAAGSAAGGAAYSLDR